MSITFVYKRDQCFIWVSCCTLQCHYELNVHMLVELNWIAKRMM